MVEEACSSPRYWRMNVPGLRSLAAKSPLWPDAGWEGEVMGVILTGVHGPLDVFGGIGGVSGAWFLRFVRLVEVSVRE